MRYELELVYQTLLAQSTETSFNFIQKQRRSQTLNRIEAAFRSTDMIIAKPWLNLQPPFQKRFNLCFPSNKFACLDISSNIA